MKRGISRSLVRPPKTTQTEIETPSSHGDNHTDAAPAAFKRAAGGAGSAWKAGAVAQAQGDLEHARNKLATDILCGSHVLEIDPSILSDPIGSDRRDDWMEQEDFRSFVESIRNNGQEMPVLIWPKDPEWRPDDIDPENLEHVQFLLLAGRRRREAARKLGRPVRAVIASQDGRSGVEATFNMLVMRFRENDEREDLSAFERLISIGQMYEEFCASTQTKIKAKDFAVRIGVHESVVSRARAIFKVSSVFLDEFKNVYDMSFRELQNALATLTREHKTKAKSATKAQKILISRKVGSRKLLVSSQGGKLSVSAAGLNLDKESLEGLSDVIAAYLDEQESKK